MIGTRNKGVFIDLRTDFGFKHCMGDVETMKSFLNAILSDDYGTIKQLEFLPVEQTRDHPSLRGVTFDLRCQLENGDDVIVEMQNYAHPFFKTRANYYLYNLMDKHITKGTSWSEMQEDIPRMIGIFILGVPMDELNEVVTKTAECDLDKRTEFWDRMRKYYISLPKFRLVMEETGLTAKDVWLETIKNLGNMEKIDPRVYERADEGLLKLIEKAKVSALSEAEYAQYEAELKVISNWGAPERYGFDQGMKRGLKEGLEKGLAEGLEKGMAEGLEKGMEKEKIAIAQMMLNKGYPIGEICEITGVDENTVAKMKAEK